MTNTAAPLRNLAPFTLGEIAQATGGILSSPSHLQIRGVSTDTRNIEPGSLFIALRGERFDGHAFLAKAAEQGSLAAVVENIEDIPPGLATIRVADTTKALGDLAHFHRRRFSIPVIGITGSYGKTTTRALVAAALSPAYNVLASTANFNNEIGVPLTLLQLDESHGMAVIEMGMRGAGQIAELARIVEPSGAVITNIGPQHIELLGSLEAIAAAKAELLAHLPASGIAILPERDGNAAFLYQSLPEDARTVTFGSGENADFRLANITTQTSGNIAFDVLTASLSQPLHLSLPMPGAHNALNAAAALAVAHMHGVPLDKAALALESAEVPGARMRIVQANGITIIDDSYNAGPDSMRAALQTLRDFPTSGRRVAVLGAMKELGAWSEEEHRKIGALAAEIADELFAVGEETKDLLSAVVGKTEHWFATSDEAAPIVCPALHTGDVVLVKGSRSVGLEKVVSALVD